MAYQDNNQGGFQKQMFQGNWKCSKCGADITELPFEPNPERVNELLCKNCHREKRQSFRGNDNFQGPRQTFQGDWKCSKCGAAITELPFQPDPARVDQLLCRNCHREKRQSFR